ncbi:MAG: TadE family protein [Acidobacteriota bacterium]
MKASGKISSARTECQKGAAIIESALIMLGFLLILFGIMEAGRVMNVQQILTDAAREGARYAVAPLPSTNTLPSTAQIQSVVDGFLQAGSITGATVTVQKLVIIPINGVNKEHTRVRVDLPYRPIVGTLFFPTTLNLKGEALMRDETSP